MLIRLSPQDGVLESPQSQALQISAPRFHLIDRKWMKRKEVKVFETPLWRELCHLSELTSNGINSKRLQSISSENTVTDTSLRAIRVPSLSLCDHCACEMKKKYINM